MRLKRRWCCGQKIKSGTQSAIRHTPLSFLAYFVTIWSLHAPNLILILQFFVWLAKSYNTYDYVMRARLSFKFSTKKLIDRALLKNASPLFFQCNLCFLMDDLLGIEDWSLVKHLCLFSNELFKSAENNGILWKAAWFPSRRRIDVESFNEVPSHPVGCP